MLLLASQPLEEPTPSAALNLLSSIEQCQMGMTSTHVTNLTELASTLGSKTFKKKNDAVIKKLVNWCNKAKYFNFSTVRDLPCCLTFTTVEGSIFVCQTRKNLKEALLHTNCFSLSLSPDMNMRGIF